MVNPKKLVAVIPCLNEAASISRTISNLRAAYPTVEIIVIDNGSSDNTVPIASALGAKVIIEPRKGKGFAVHTGFNVVPKDASAVLMVDGDDTYGFEGLSRALELVTHEGYDMVVGSRKTGAEHVKDQSFRRGHRFGNFLLSWIYTKLFKIKLEDTLSGWRMMSTTFVKSFPGSASSFEIEAELNVHAYNLNSAVKEVEISYRARVEGSISKLNTYRDGWLILKRNMSLYRSERPAIAFKFLGLPWFLASALLVSVAVSDYIKTGEVARFPSLIAGVGSFIIATNLWMTGMILERVRLQRVAQLKFRYSDFLR